MLHFLADHNKTGLLYTILEGENRDIVIKNLVHNLHISGKIVSGKKADNWKTPLSIAIDNKSIDFVSKYQPQSCIK